MTASIILRSSEISLGSFEELLAKGYDLATNFNSMPCELLKSAPRNSPTGRIFQNIIDNPDLSYISYDEALELMKNNPKVVACYSVLPFLAWSDLHQIKDFEGSYFHSNSFCLQKDSEFLGLFNFERWKLLQSGVHDKILRKWGITSWTKKGTETLGKNNLESEGLSYLTVVSPFIVLCAGIVGSTILLVVEVLK